MLTIEICKRNYTQAINDNDPVAAHYWVDWLKNVMIEKDMWNDQAEYLIKYLHENVEHSCSPME